MPICLDPEIELHAPITIDQLGGNLYLTTSLNYELQPTIEFTLSCQSIDSSMTSRVRLIVVDIDDNAPVKTNTGETDDPDVETITSDVIVSYSYSSIVAKSIAR